MSEEYLTPPRRWSVNNRHTALTELKVDETVVSPVVDRETPLLIDLRTGLMNLVLDETTEVEVGFLAYEIHLSLDGVESVPGVRYGDDKLLEEERTTSSTSLKSTMSREDRAGLDGTIAAAPRMGVKAHSARAATSENVESFQHEVVKRFVTARPGDVWHIQGNGAPLEKTVLDSSTSLCRLRPLQGGNRSGVKISVVARKKKLWFDSQVKEGRFWRLLDGKSANHSKIFKVLVAKGLCGETSTHSDGHLLELSTIDNHDI